jgi:hypothetical protein
MSMAGRPGFGSRVVLLVAVLSTLLATWVPPARACACGIAGVAVDRAPSLDAPARACPCCGHQPGDSDLPECCRDHQAAPETAPGRTCDCSSTADSQMPDPAVPPRPSDPDELAGPTTLDSVATLEHARPPVTTPGVEAARGRAGPPPVDLIISLLRITC